MEMILVPFQLHSRWKQTLSEYQKNYVQPCWDTEIENVNGEMSILIEHLIHHDWIKCKASELDMNFKTKMVVASKDGKFPQI